MFIGFRAHGSAAAYQRRGRPLFRNGCYSFAHFEQKGPAILFEKVKGSKFRAASNIFGTLERSEFIFRDTLPSVKQLIDIKINPLAAIQNPIKSLAALPAAINALPNKNPISKPVLFEEINISD